jgi:hypothetical protein
MIDAHLGVIEHRNHYNEVVVWGNVYEDNRGLATRFRIIHIEVDEHD